MNAQIKRSVNNEPVIWIDNDILKGSALPDHQTVANYIGQHIGEVYTI